MSRPSSDWECYAFIEGQKTKLNIDFLTKKLFVIMKNSIRNAAKNNILFIDFQSFAIDLDKQQMVKGGGDIVIQDVIDV